MNSKLYLYILVIFLFLTGCQSTPSLPQEAFHKGTLCNPPYDVNYNLLWDAAITATQELGYLPSNSYRENHYIQTDLRVQEDLGENKKKATQVYIFFEKKKGGIRPEYILRICVPRYESPLDKESWTYLGADTSLQQRVKHNFQKALEKLYRERRI
ncbi:MAG: hypothetical protein D6785_03155 [Planctomycetota bacterium]|nr:MAG: hypothetical protein D6785_03155 [Planctomycetota bacterium]